MARKRRSYRRGFRAGKRRARKGFGLPKLLDVSQIVDNTKGLGYFTAIKSLMAGHPESAADDIASAATDPNVMFGLALDNIFIGITRKIIRATGGKWVRKVVA